MKRYGIAAILLSAILLTSCGADELTAGEKFSYGYGEVAALELNDFSIRLFDACMSEGENTLISPLSVLFALGMTAEGACGNTLSEIEAAVGRDIAELSESLNSVYSTIESAQGDKQRVRLADSIWMREYDFTPNEEFLKRNAEVYAADVYSAPFDSSTLHDINKWVSGKTDGMIKDILDEIPEDAIMYLVNALSFECEWKDIYKKNDVRNADFHLSDGSTKKVKMMYSEETSYLEGKDFSGFIKYYSGGKYAFAAILPNEDSSVEKVIDSLDGENLTKLLNEPVLNGVVSAGIPKFSAEYSAKLNDVLKKLGISDAFDPDKADLSNIGASPNGNIFISRILHKAFIEVAEKGTKAGAATVVEAVDECAIIYDKAYEVVLDRPFIYFIYSTESCVPLFIGTYAG